jgi:hypothetical protein
VDSAGSGEGGMGYGNTREEKMLLQTRLAQVLEARRIPLTRLQDHYRLWAKEKKLPFASKETLDNWLDADFSDRRNPNWDAQKAAALHDFLKSNYHDSETGTLLHLLEKRFHAPHNLPLAYLNSLCGGPFAMFRRLWWKPESNEYIRSIVTFTHDEGVFKYEEKQDFLDAAKEIHRLEIDHGFALIYGFNVYMMALDNAVHCMKFLVMHDSDPVLDGKTKAGICKGTMIGIYGRGPHPGEKFIMRRIVGDDLESRIVSENDLDDDTKAYLTG